MEGEPLFPVAFGDAAPPAPTITTFGPGPTTIVGSADPPPPEGPALVLNPPAPPPAPTPNGDVAFPLAPPPATIR